MIATWSIGRERIGSVNPISGTTTTFTAVKELPPWRPWELGWWRIGRRTRLDGHVIATFIRGDGERIRGRAEVTVIAPPKLGWVEIEPKEATILPGESIHFTTRVYDDEGKIWRHGGLSYQWYIGDKKLTGETEATLTYRFEEAGKYKVKVVVRYKDQEKTGKASVESVEVIAPEVKFRKVEGIDSDGTAKITAKVTPEIDISLAELRLNGIIKDTLKNVRAGELTFSFNQNDLKVGKSVITVRVQLKGSDTIIYDDTTAKKRIVHTSKTKRLFYRLPFPLVAGISPFWLSHELTEHTWSVEYAIKAHGKTIRSNFSEFKVDFSGAPPDGFLEPLHLYGLTHFIKEGKHRLSEDRLNFINLNQEGVKSHLFDSINKVWVKKSAEGVATEMVMTIWCRKVMTTVHFHARPRFILPWRAPPWCSIKVRLAE